MLAHFLLTLGLEGRATRAHKQSAHIWFPKLSQPQLQYVQVAHVRVDAGRDRGRGVASLVQRYTSDQLSPLVVSFPKGRNRSQHRRLLRLVDL